MTSHGGVVLTLLLIGCFTTEVLPSDNTAAYQEGYDRGRSDAEAAFEDRLASLEAEVARLGGEVDANASGVSANAAAVAAIEADYATEAWVSEQIDAVGGGGGGGVPGLGDYLTVDTSAHALIIAGANVHIQSGSGATGDAGSPVGLGNLIIGYDEDGGWGADGVWDSGDDKSGSHNLVIGPFHSYPGVGGVVGGYDNHALGNHAGLFGAQNVASGERSSVTGGTQNSAGGDESSIGGGEMNTTVSAAAHIAGGWGGNVAGDHGAILGGKDASVGANYGAVVGGLENTALSTYSSVVGGEGNRASGVYAAVLGGQSVIESGDHGIYPPAP